MGDSVEGLSTVGVLRLASLVTARWYGGLCGNGDISIISTPGAGEDDGSGGVVIVSSIYTHEQPANMMLSRHLPRPLPCAISLFENKDRRGVSSCGLFLG